MIPRNRKQETMPSGAVWAEGWRLESKIQLQEPVSFGCSNPMGQSGWPAGAPKPRVGTGHWSGAGDSSGIRALKGPCEQKSHVGGQLANCLEHLSYMRRFLLLGCLWEALVAPV